MVGYGQRKGTTLAGEYAAKMVNGKANVGVLEGQPGYHSTGRSAALFMESYGTAQVRAEPMASAELARLCGHLPLALRIAAANILGNTREADYTAVPRVVFTDPQAAAVGEPDGPLTATVPLADVPRTSTYTRAYAEHAGFMTLVSDGEVVTGAYAVGPDAGEWLQQATLAIRARVPLTVFDDVIQPFPTFSEVFLHALQELKTKRLTGAVA